MRRLGLVLLALLAMVGCGGRSAGIGQAAAGQLGPQVDQVRVAAMSGDRATAAAKLAQLRTSVTDLRQRHQLSEAGAARVLAAAAEVETQLATPGPVATPAPQATTTPAPATGVTSATRPPQVPDNKGDEGDNKGKGNGKGKD